MNNWEILALKIAIAAAVAIFGLSGTLLPWLLKRRQTSEKILVLSDTFAGGVLGGAGFIHLLNSGIEQFKSALPDVHYPVALLLTGAGFMLILLIEGVLATPRRSWQPLPKGSSFNLRHQASQPPDGTHAAYYPVILLIVLSAHSIILGLALGSQQSLTDIIIVFLAIIAHKGAAGFALGAGYARIGARVRQVFPQLVIFIFMTPLGIIAGGSISLSLDRHPAQLFEAVFDALGAGTFIYIAAVDIIKTQFDKPGYPLQKWLATVAGFSIMAVLAIWL